MRTHVALYVHWSQTWRSGSHGDAGKTRLHSSELRVSEEAFWSLSSDLAMVGWIRRHGLQLDQDTCRASTSFISAWRPDGGEEYQDLVLDIRQPGYCVRLVAELCCWPVLPWNHDLQESVGKARCP